MKSIKSKKAEPFQHMMPWAVANDDTLRLNSRLLEYKQLGSDAFSGQIVDLGRLVLGVVRFNAVPSQFSL